MAKIYETKEDFQKDALESQAKDLRLKAAHQAGTGSAMIGTNFFIDLWQARRGGGSGLIALASSLLGIVGVVQVVKSFFTDHKAHDLELQRERMGPTRIVLPPDVMLPGDVPEKDCGCKHKRHAASGPTSLIEQAQKTDSTSQVRQ